MHMIHPYCFSQSLRESEQYSTHWTLDMALTGHVILVYHLTYPLVITGIIDLERNCKAQQWLPLILNVMNAAIQIGVITRHS